MVQWGCGTGTLAVLIATTVVVGAAATIPTFDAADVNVALSETGVVVEYHGGSGEWVERRFPGTNLLMEDDGNTARIVVAVDGAVVGIVLGTAEAWESLRTLVPFGPPAQA